MGLRPAEDELTLLSGHAVESVMEELLSPRRKGLGKGLTQDHESPVLSLEQSIQARGDDACICIRMLTSFHADTRLFAHITTPDDNNPVTRRQALDKDLLIPDAEPPPDLGPESRPEIPEPTHRYGLRSAKKPARPTGLSLQQEADAWEVERNRRRGSRDPSPAPLGNDVAAERSGSSVVSGRSSSREPEGEGEDLDPAAAREEGVATRAVMEGAEACHQ